MNKILTRKVKWIEMTENEYYSRGTNGVHFTEYMGIGYTMEDYYREHCGIQIDPRGNGDYEYTNEDGEKMLIIVWEYFDIAMTPYNIETYIGTLEEAQTDADSMICYTQQDVLIFGETENGEHNLIARRRWYGVEIDEDAEDKDACISFGKSGHYGEWEVFDY